MANDLEGNPVSLCNTFDPGRVSTRNLPFNILLAVKNGWLKLFTTPIDVHLVNYCQWGQFAKDQCRILDEQSPWREDQAELRLKVFGLTSESHAIAAAFVSAMDRNGEKTYAMLFYDPNNEYLMKIAVPWDLDTTDKWDFESAL